jgi:adenylate kinase
MNILMFGIQGAGKSTVGKYVAEKLNIPFIATGDIFRELKQEDSALGKLVRNKIDIGELVPDELTMEIVNQRLEKNDSSRGFILDGAPRNLDQIKMFKFPVDLIMLINLEREEAVKRLLIRARHDDTKEAIEKRIAWYENQTKPVIDFYKSENTKIIEVDNTPLEEAVQKKLDEQFKELKRN